MLNVDDSFSGGVKIGSSGLLVSQSQVSVGGSPLAGTLRSAGSVRAKKGTPLSESISDLDAGFAFDEDSASGLFHEGFL